MVSESFLLVALIIARMILLLYLNQKCYFLLGVVLLSSGGATPQLRFLSRRLGRRERVGGDHCQHPRGVIYSNLRGLLVDHTGDFACGF